MNIQFLKNNIKLIVGSLVVLLVVVFAVLQSGQVPAPANPNSTVKNSDTPASSSPTTGVNNSPTGKTTQQSTLKPAVKTSSAPSISMITPASGEVWLSGKFHTIRWGHAMGYSGTVVLLDAATKAILGTITPTVISGQATYSWDTNTVSLNRTNPLKQTISPGTYIVKVIYDNSHGFIESAPFSVIATGQETIKVSNISIQGSLFSPNMISVKQGQFVAIVNNDAVAHIVKMSGTVTVATLAPNDSFAIDTSVMQPDSYELKIAENQITKLTLTVQ